jgi:hypothetical protein
MNILQLRRACALGTGGVVAAFAWANLTPLRAQNNVPITVTEMGAGANEVVNITSSNLGANLWVYACVIDIEVDNTPTLGFCIDPWDWSGSGPMSYTAEALADGPKVASGMGAATALQIEQLWEEFYSPNMSDATAAGLQIAIWDLVSAAASAETNGADWYTLNSGNDYGASTMISWVDAHPFAIAATLSAISGPGQDYVVMSSVIPQPPTAAVAAPTSAYTGSPISASSTATAPDDNLTLHSVEWLSPSGAWTVNSAAASGGSDQRTVAFTFPTTGTWTVRAGASVDNGVTWVYSPTQQINVTSGLTTYTLESMAVPPSSLVGWYTPSAVATQTYQVQHVNQ